MSTKKKNNKKSAERTSTKCFHDSSSSTHDHPLKREYQRHLDKVMDQYYADLVDANVNKSSEGGEYGILTQVVREFNRAHTMFCADEGFARHIFAWSAEQWLKQRYEQAAIAASFGLILRYMTIPHYCRGEDSGLGTTNREQHDKYQRRIQTSRGLLLVIAKHIPCNCLDEFVDVAKTERPTAVCYGCAGEYPREKLSLCSRCKNVRYCCRECQVGDW